MGPYHLKSKVQITKQDYLKLSRVLSRLPFLSLSCRRFHTLSILAPSAIRISNYLRFLTLPVTPYLCMHNFCLVHSLPLSTDLLWPTLSSLKFPSVSLHMLRKVNTLSSELTQTIVTFKAIIFYFPHSPTWHISDSFLKTFPALRTTART